MKITCVLASQEGGGGGGMLSSSTGATFSDAGSAGAASFPTTGDLTTETGASGSTIFLNSSQVGGAVSTASKNAAASLSSPLSSCALSDDELDELDDEAEAEEYVEEEEVEEAVLLLDFSRRFSAALSLCERRSGLLRVCAPRRTENRTNLLGKCVISLGQYDCHSSSCSAPVKLKQSFYLSGETEAVPLSLQ